MLKKLTIEQFVIIDRSDLDFRPGLTVLTGETGAGKSILLDAFGLILGNPSDPDAIRQGAEKSEIEAHFHLPAGSPVMKFLAEKNFAMPTQQELQIRRVTKTDGEEEILVNGKPAPLDVVKTAGEMLGEIHGQHANQSLLEPANQLHLLDLSGDYPPEVFPNVANALNSVTAYKQEQEDEQNFLNANLRYQDAMAALVARFDSAGMNEMTVAEIKAEYARLLTAKETMEAFQEITAHLVSSSGAVRLLNAANLALSRQKNLDKEKVQTLAKYLADALENTRAAVSETAARLPEYEIDLNPLRIFKERLDTLEALSVELKTPVDGLTQYYKDLVAKLNRVRNGRARQAELVELIQQAETDYRHHAHILTGHRIKVGETLSQRINAELPPLKLMRAEFKVLVEESPKNPWTVRGFNSVTFTARMNPGMPFTPISETASGGEMARLVLAMKAVLQTVVNIPTLVFDEVDVGIGGSAAAAVGERIARLAETTQVLVITHSPQVASRGEQHLHVSKRAEGDKTISSLTVLSLDQRIDEISRMLAGDVITPESRAAAKTLIDEASSAAASRRKTG